MRKLSPWGTLHKSLNNNGRSTGLRPRIDPTCLAEQLKNKNTNSIKNMKYLGINSRKVKNKLYPENYRTLLREIKEN